MWYYVSYSQASEGRQGKEGRGRKGRASINDCHRRGGSIGRVGRALGCLLPQSACVVDDVVGGRVGGVWVLR